MLKLLTRASNTDRFSLNVILFSSILQRKQLLKVFMYSNTPTKVMSVLASSFIYTSFGIFERHQVIRSVAAAFQQTGFEISASVSSAYMTEIFEGRRHLLLLRGPHG